MQQLIQNIKNCSICEKHLSHGVRPVFVASAKAKINIIGQAPGSKVHASGIPWDDASGKRLRQWLNVDPETFYNPDNFAIVPMGFCYPGKGKSGDLPPRPECAPQWHQPLLKQMPNIKLTLLIGSYAQDYYLGKEEKLKLTERVRRFENYLPNFLPLPHPSPRNEFWIRKNPWFEEQIIPELQRIVSKALV